MSEGDSNKPNRKKGELVSERGIVSIFRRGRMWFANFQVNAKQNRPKLDTKSKKEALTRARRLEDQVVACRYRDARKTGNDS